MAKSAVPRIFVTLAAPTLSAMEAKAADISGSPIGFGLRLDYLQDFGNLETNLHLMLTRLHSAHTIATCRREKAGGQFKGSVGDQLAVLEAAARAGCHWVDLEMESVGRQARILRRRFRPAKLIVSYHHYRRMPALPSIYRRLARLPAHAVKIAGFARQLSDNLQVFRLLKAHRRARPKLVALAQGPSGIPSRLLSLRWGAPFTYAAASNHQAVAAGQLSVETMRSSYRVEHIDRRTQLYGVVGTHASMSLSPAMQNAAFQAKRVGAVYLPCETGRLKDFLRLVRALSFQGFSITMPYKRAIIRDLDWLDPLATRIGACNTVAIQHGKWLGWNTDATAVIEVLTKRLRLAGSRILILGAGGAACAAAHALRAEDAEVFVAARREAAARRLARVASAQIVPWGDAEALDMDAVINATPVGMAPYSDAVPIDLARLRVRVVFDMVYYPMETRLLAEARGRGLITISGLEMLVAQGARQFEIWTGLAAPRALMEQAIRQALEHTASG